MEKTPSAERMDRGFTNGFGEATRAEVRTTVSPIFRESHVCIPHKNLLITLSVVGAMAGDTGFERCGDRQTTTSVRSGGPAAADQWVGQ